MSIAGRKVRVGVFGAGRGQTMVNVLSRHPDAELTAICDFSESMLRKCRKQIESAGTNVTLYEDFDKFINHDMDAVILANYATEHAPFAVRLLDSGRHVCSEVLACQTMAEGVALAEAVERNKKVYAYAENYCYFRGTQEMRRLYERGDLGEFLHGEGEYVHDCEGIWTVITGGKREHWRNWVASTYYCTHSIGPIVTITGTRPIRVTAYETPNLNKRTFGCRSGEGSVLVCQMSNGATAKFLPWCNYRREPGSVWYSVYGTEGMAETDRWGDGVNKVNLYTKEAGRMVSYSPDFPPEFEQYGGSTGHGGSDFFTMHHFLARILDRPGKEKVIDVYTALDMTFPGILGYRSICEGNVPFEVPNFRDPVVRERYRNDNWCLDPKMAGPGQPVHSCSFGPVDVPDSIYEAQQKEYPREMGFDK